MRRRMPIVLALWAFSVAAPVAAPVAAQPAPTLTVSGTTYTLTVPYLEAATTPKLAYSAALTSATLAEFTLDASSVQALAVIAAAGDPARLEAAGAAYRLSLPYLEASAGGVTKAYAASLTTSDFARFRVEAGSVREVALRVALAAPTAVTAAELDRQTVGSRSFGSSTQLRIGWSAPAAAVDHYEITATEASMNTRATAVAAGSATTATLAALKAATAYAITVKACADSACTQGAASAPIHATTAAEYWQLQGSGNSVATLLQPVADGNARLSATRFGPDAGATANTVQFYYGPRGVNGLAVAASGAVNAAQPSSYLSFTSLAASTGIRSPSNATSGIRTVATGQGVPLSAAMGGSVRLFFEANDADGRTRIYAVDSVDGYAGRDFNRGAATTCTQSVDYGAGGNCPAALVIGVEGDATGGNPRIANARQNKVAWPALTDWRWDGATGTFMVFTVDAIAGCTGASHNHAYALWNGSRFVVQYAADGCPKLFKSAQAALPVHIGGARYKLYYGDPSVTAGRVPGSPLPFVGPKKLIYADGASTGHAAIVEFEDWESTSTARDVRFLWPNGELLSDAAEGYIDDFHVLTPTGSLELQVIYVTITDGTVIPFAAAAVLLNP